MRRLQLIPILLLLTPLGGQAQVHGGKTLVKPRLVAEARAIQVGRPLTVGVYFQIEKGWHLYWENAGDGGLPISVNWKLPAGFRVAPLRWPTPRRFDEAGGLTTYGYTNETMLLARVMPPSSVTGDTVTLAADLSWLVCQELCLPGHANVELKLPTGRFAPSHDAALIARFERQLPRPLSYSALRIKSAVATKRAGPDWLIRIDLVGQSETPREFFPRALDRFTMDHHKVTIQGASIFIPVTTSQEGLTPNVISGILRTDRHAYELQTKLDLRLRP